MLFVSTIYKSCFFATNERLHDAELSNQYYGLFDLYRLHLQQQCWARVIVKMVHLVIWHGRLKWSQQWERSAPAVLRAATVP